MKQNAIFRGKTELGVWVYGYYMYSELQDKHFILGGSKDYGFQKEEVISETVGQFTGLTDKNGVKIFVGSIIPDKIFINCDPSKSTMICNGVHQKSIIIPHFVRYNNAIGGFELYNEEYKKTTSFWVAGKRIKNETEVIGNVHDNPELLNK